MAIPKGYFGKIFPRSGLLKKHFVTCDAGVADADYRGSVCVLIITKKIHTMFELEIELHKWFLS